MEKPVAKRMKLKDMDIRTLVKKNTVPNEHTVDDQQERGAPPDQEHGDDSTTDTGESSQEPAKDTQEPGTRNLQEGPGTQLEAEGTPGHQHQHQAEQSDQDPAYHQPGPRNQLQRTRNQSRD